MCASSCQSLCWSFQFCSSCCSCTNAASGAAILSTTTQHVRIRPCILLCCMLRMSVLVCGCVTSTPIGGYDRQGTSGHRGHRQSLDLFSTRGGKGGKGGYVHLGVVSMHVARVAMFGNVCMFPCPSPVYVQCVQLAGQSSGVLQATLCVLHHQTRLSGTRWT